MPSAPREIVRLQIHGAQLREVFSTYRGEFVQQLRQRLSHALLHLTLAVERLERPRLAELHDHPGPWNPVRPLRMNQMPDDVEGIPRTVTFISTGQRLRQTAQKRIESRRS